MENNLQLATANLYSKCKGRYLTLETIQTFCADLSIKFVSEIIGYSVLNLPILAIKFGNGPRKILIWSQMHGNEATSTKGLLDYLNYLNTDVNAYTALSNQFTVVVVPLLNPDGAKQYTRENANGVDLNRDAFECTQPESIVLRNLVHQFQPDYCFNLHDQRTLFGLLESKKPATISFLTAAYDESRLFNTTRESAAKVIVAMHQELERYIPGQVGRFDDSFNINCTGDYFTSTKIPTILFEAGHFQNDYDREEVRKFVFISLKTAFYCIYENVVVDSVIEKYLDIYENNKCFADIIFKNVKIIENNVEKIINFAVNYKEVLFDNSVIFEARIIEFDSNSCFMGHKEINAKEKLFKASYGGIPKVGEKADFYLANIEFVNGEAK
nr:M14 family zinc carboxypeptidase [uncultured Flavobacterium sp.]